MTNNEAKAISFKNVSKLFEGSGGRKAAVHDVSFDVQQGELVVLLGPSGCGKTTLMRLVNRLIEPTSGEIFVNGSEIHQISGTELRRHIGYVIQQVGLFPHMTVAQNISVVPKLLRWDREKIRTRTDELLDLVSLPPREYRKRYPRQLSGGQQQRVGIARAMAADPQIMLMDEPFGAIDAITRGDLQNELLSIQRKVSKTIIFVTHDVDEALRLADRIAVMRDGDIVQYDTPVKLLARPADAFVRTLLGADDVFRQLSLIPVSSVMESLDGTAAGGASLAKHDGHLSVSAEQDVRSALSLLMSHGVEELRVINGTGSTVGRLTLKKVLAEAERPEDG
jgi:osmoprotectant transport system ATP-binding protein